MAVLMKIVTVWLSMAGADSSELFQLDTAALKWTELVDATSSWPSARFAAGFEAVGDGIFLFGGTNSSGCSFHKFFSSLKSVVCCVNFNMGTKLHKYLIY